MGERYPVGKSPLNTAHEWQYYRSNYQTDVWDNAESVSADKVRCVTVVPTAARISAADAVRCTTATRRITRSSPSVVSRGRQEPCHPLTTAPHNPTQWIHSGQVFIQHRGRKINLLILLPYCMATFKLGDLFIMSS
ncbi:hypothetical protein TNCV_1286091 [Trichonephila clavipes]|uniref:Uncharacterized protein n=1 Tax=Trichonephila clavipes TaxID=2585209 RepID=A0A8X6VKA7_TRICX|nr:hypothetical protein TNCV_1286091 [Trichonephila clavipes]